MKNRIYKIIKINYLICLLSVSYILTIIAMDISSTGFSIEGTIITLPLFIFIILFIHKNFYILKIKDAYLTKNETFLRDYLYVNSSFILAGFLSLLFQYNNNDAKAWWPFFFYINFFYGALYGLLYAFISKLLNRHLKYTIYFSIITLFIFTLSKYWHNYTNNYYIDGYFIIFIGIISLHLFLCIMFKLISVNYSCDHL